MGDPAVIRIFDTTLRDGEQSPGATMTTPEKIHVAEQLVRLNVDIIEAGFPAASPGDLEAVKEIARHVRDVAIAGLARAAVSRNLCPTVEFSAEDATRSDWDYLCRVFEAAIKSGATTINVPDTVGYTTPYEYEALFRYLRERVPGIEDVVMSAHCHNDLGMATANTLAAIKAGARQVEVTINGMGERAGNTAMEEVVMALRTRPDFFGNVDTRINAREFLATSQLVSKITGIPVQPNKSVVGYEAGLRQAFRAAWPGCAPETARL